MKNKITIGIFAHANAGKTTLTEQLLVRAGVLKTVGRVDYGNTFTDNLNIEKERGITVRASLVNFSAGKNEYNLIDTPGHIDFVAEVERTMAILDIAVLVISGVESIESQTYAIFNTLQKNNIPIIIFINKMDRKGADLERVIKDLKIKFKANFVQMNTFENSDVKKLPTESIMEELAILSETNLDLYLAKKYENWFDLLNKDFCNSNVYPIFVGSALTNKGMGDIFKFLSDINFEPQEFEDELSCFIYQVRIENGIKNYYTKILGGELTKKDSFVINEEKQKIDNIKISKNGELIEVNSVSKGDIALITGLDCNRGEFIGKKTLLKQISINKPLFSVSVKCDDKNTTDLINALKNLIN